MKKNLMILALGLAAVMPAKAQWNSWHTSSTISGVLGIASSAIESAKLNCNYGYSDQQQISRKISELYVKAGRTEEGPSILKEVASSGNGLTPC